MRGIVPALDEGLDLAIGPVPVRAEARLAGDLSEAGTRKGANQAREPEAGQSRCPAA